MAHPQFRDNSWYEDFWKNQPTAYGKPSADLISLLKYARKNITGDRPTLLDVACGNGRYIPEFEDLGFIVTGIDISDEAIKLSKLKSSKANLLSADFLQDQSLKEKVFDVVFSSGYLDELTQDQQQVALEKIAKITKPNCFSIIKYCLEISGRGLQVVDNFIPEFFEANGWTIIHTIEESELRKYLNGVPGEDHIRTGTILTQKYAQAINSV